MRADHILIAERTDPPEMGDVVLREEVLWVAWDGSDGVGFWHGDWLSIDIALDNHVWCVHRWEEEIRDRWGITREMCQYNVGCKCVDNKSDWTIEKQSVRPSFAALDREIRIQGEGEFIFFIFKKENLDQSKWPPVSKKDQWSKKMGIAESKVEIEIRDRYYLRSF